MDSMTTSRTQVLSWLGDHGHGDHGASLAEQGRGSSLIQRLRYRFDRVTSLTNIFAGPPNQSGRHISDGREYNMSQSPLLGYSKQRSYHSDPKYMLIHQGHQSLFKHRFSHDFLGDAVIPLAGGFGLLFVLSLTVLCVNMGFVGAAAAFGIVLPVTIGLFNASKSSLETSSNDRFDVLDGSGLTKLTNCDHLTAAGVRYIRRTLGRHDGRTFRRLNGQVVSIGEVNGHHYVLESGWFSATLRRFSSTSTFEDYIGSELPEQYHALVGEAELV